MFSSNNYDSLVKVINGLGSSQLDFRFLGCVQSWLWALTCKTQPKIDEQELNKKILNWKIIN